VEWFEPSILGAPGIIRVNVLRAYLGKELSYAFRGYRSYFEAKDYKP